MVHGAVDIVHIALRQKRLTVRNPVLDGKFFALGQGAVAMGFDVAIANVGDGDLFHIDPALPVFCVDAEDDSAIFTHTEVKLGQSHGKPQVSPAQKDLIRSQASVRASSEVA